MRSGELLRDGASVLRRQGLGPFCWRALHHSTVWPAAWNTYTSRHPIGTNLFDHDWDLMIVLDACRVDALRRRTSAIPGDVAVGKVRSVGSMSAEWTLQTFTETYRPQIERTSLLTRNVWSERILADRYHERDDHDYGMINMGWPDWNPVSTEAFERFEWIGGEDRLHEEHPALPHVTTDRAIKTVRRHENNRVIVHYLLPHLPFIGDAIDWAPNEVSVTDLMAGPAQTRELAPEERDYDDARRGAVSVDAMRDLYGRNLDLVLEYVGVLLRNVDAERVVISADHGEGFGQGTVWGHPYAYPFAPVKTVPFATTSASDHGTYDPQYDAAPETPHDVDEVLDALGYA